MESYRESHKGKGADYQQTFSTVPHRAILWKLERRVLDRILRQFFPRGVAQYLDFACGTGRILRHLEDRVDSAIGVDIAQSMLEVARTNVSKASIIEADITRVDVLADQHFDLITAFRFFPNAEPRLRFDVLFKLVEHLKPGGYLVFNNHLNKNSLVRRIVRWRGGHIGDDGTMSKAEVDDLVGKAHLHIVHAYPLGVLPITEKWTPRPYWLMTTLESWGSCIPGAVNLAQDVIYVCRK